MFSNGWCGDRRARAGGKSAALSRTAALLGCARYRQTNPTCQTLVQLLFSINLRASFHRNIQPSPRAKKPRVELAGSLRCGGKSAPDEKHDPKLKPHERSTTDGAAMAPMTDAEAAILQLAREAPELGQVAVAERLRSEGLRISPSGVRYLWQKHGLRLR